MKGSVAIIAFGVVLFAGGMALEIGFILRRMDEAKAECVRRGGENMDVGRGFVCVKRGTVIP